MLNVSHIKELVRIFSEDEANTRPLLDLIQQYYTVYNPIDNTGISVEIEDIELLMMQLSQKRKRRIKRLIGDLCEEHERAAFIEGIRVGGSLLMQILDEGEKPQTQEGDG